MASTPFGTRLVTPRDLEIFTALDHTPLTATQLLKLSEIFARPFTSERRVRERLQTLCDAGRVRRWQYATAEHGVPNYYTLTRLGYQILYGEQATPPTKRYFGPVAIANQHHTQSLAEFIVHTRLAAHRTGVTFTSFYRENALRLVVGDEMLYPDCAFQLVRSDGQELSFMVELDNSTERIRSDKDLDSWQRKIRLYDRLQDDCPKRFRVLVVTTRSMERLTHILAAAAELVRNSKRSLFYGIHLDKYRSESAALTATCFLDHRGRHVALVPKQQRADPSAVASNPAFSARTHAAVSRSTRPTPPCYASAPAGSPA